MSIKVFWANSFFSGLVARELAGKCFLVDCERIFVGGLLAEIGHLILYGQMPEQPEQALRESATVSTPIDAAEQNILGFDFTEIGQILVEVWQPPKTWHGDSNSNYPKETRDYASEAALLNIANLLMEGFQSPKGYMDSQKLVTP